MAAVAAGFVLVTTVVTFVPVAAASTADPSASPGALAGGVDGRTTAFSDVGEGHAFATEITWAADAGLVNGFPDGTFRPAGELTRQAYVAFLYRMLTEPEPVPSAALDGPAPVFSDVSESHPFFAEITWAAQVGLVDGFPDGTFRPTAPVTRQAAAAFTARAAAMVEATFVHVPEGSGESASAAQVGDVGDAAAARGDGDATAAARDEGDEGPPPLFPDVAADHPFVFDIAITEGVGLLRGYADGTFRPDIGLTRQAAAALLYRLGELADPGYTPVWTPVACTTLTPVGRTTDCGTLTVPENRADPTGPTIELAVAVVRTNHASPLPDPAVYLGGGPGGTVMDSLRGRYKVTLGEQRDVIMFDQRGVGLSVPDLECPERDEALLDTYGTADPFPVELERMVDASLECRDRLVDDGVDLGAYTTVASALDVRDLRRALGYQQWNLYGISYGTALAQQAVMVDPFGTRTVIYDSTYPLDSTVADAVADGGDRVFTQLWEGCAAQPTCLATYPDLEGLFWDTVAAYDADPLAVTIPDPLGAGNRDLLITGADVTAGLFGALYRTDFIPVLPTIIAAIADRDTATMQLVATEGLAGLTDLVDGVFLSVECHDRWDGTTQAEVEALIATAPQFGSIYYTVAHGYCETWDVPTAPARFNRLPTTRVPGLVMAGTYDPITPPEGGVRLDAALADSLYVEFPQVGHGVLTNANVCANSLARQFLAGPVDEIDVTCLASEQPPTFS